ncbi:MAG: hypothetical protein QXN97_05555 [Desulfurococcaceae archaeon]
MLGVHTIPRHMENNPHSINPHRDRPSNHTSHNSGRYRKLKGGDGRGSTPEPSSAPELLNPSHVATPLGYCEDCFT